MEGVRAEALGRTKLAFDGLVIQLYAEGEKGRKLSWERARQEWTDAYREKFEKFLIDTLYFPDATPPEEPPAEGRAKPGMATATENATSSQT
jgi:hypothetical protein